MEKLKLIVLLGSTRKGRFSEKSARWIVEKAQERAEFDVELVDLMDYPLPFYEHELPPLMRGGEQDEPNAKKLAEKIGSGDAFIIVTPEYNHSFPAVLKNAIDYVYFEWVRKPVGFVSHGAVAGVRAVQQLHEVVIQLEAVNINKAVHIPDFWSALDESGKLKETDSLTKASTTLLDELAWWGQALKKARG